MTQPSSIIGTIGKWPGLPHLIMHNMCPMPEEWQFNKDAPGGWKIIMNGYVFERDGHDTFPYIISNYEWTAGQKQ